MKVVKDEKKASKQEEPEVVLELPGEVKFKLEYLDNGSIAMDYDNQPLNKMCGLAIARDVFSTRLNILRNPEVDKKHPAYLNTAQRANIAAAIQMINGTIQDYANHLYQEAMEEKMKEQDEADKQEKSE